MMIALFVFTLLAMAYTKTLTYSKYTAENNLYEATTSTVADSLIEQIKGASLDVLENPKKVDGKEAFEMLIERGKKQLLILNEFNELEIPIVTNDTGEQTKKLNLKLKPTITPMLNDEGYWIDVEYEFKSPDSKRIIKNTVRNARTDLPSA